MTGKTVFTILILWGALAGFDVYHSSGIVGTTRKNGHGCLCHGSLPADTVSVWIEGPRSVRAGSKTFYSLMMTGGPGVTGGFNLASNSGILIPLDTTEQAVSGELTHTAPKPFEGDTVRWGFFYVAPSATGYDTLFSAANSTNNNGIPTGDKWNFGENTAIGVVPDTMTAVRDMVPSPDFMIFQNFPNPFNPSTTISFTLSRQASVRLSVYDALGSRVALLLNRTVQPGLHEMLWNATSMPSGIYLCRLESEYFALSRKMLLVR